MTRTEQHIRNLLLILSAGLSCWLVWQVLS
jgi:hypothetical protein